MNIGIVIGVSEYDNAQDLYGCRNDAHVMNQLLELTEKCEDVLYIVESTNSKNIKSEISTFIEKYKDETVDELIFYFTGHGSFDGNEFYYILSDYDDSKKKQTSLENSELDNWLKALNPKLTIKVVDACQSGTRYIKDPDAFEKYLNSPENRFNNCYFMYSSQISQCSYQDDNVSDFTLAFIRGVIDRSEQDVRYKDIIDAIADEFESNTNQTPLFVIQGAYTERFAHISSEVAEALKVSIGLGEKRESKPIDLEKTLAQRVSSAAKYYCSKEEAVIYVGKFLDGVRKYSISSELDEIYSFHVNTLDSIPSYDFNTDFIGNYIAKSEINYFAEIDYETRTRKVRKVNALLGALTGFGADVPMVDEEYSAPTGAKSTEELPYNLIHIKCQAKFPNINDSGCFVFPFVSQTKIALLYVFFSYRVRKWDVKEIDRSTCEWFVAERVIKKSQADAIANEIIDSFLEYTVEPVKKTFGMVQKTEEVIS